MGFKVDTSFLRFLTMGALAARRVAKELTGLGFQPIELERYGTSNKIWATKVKRLRLPDALCVRTGLRVEIRAKSDLKIRMSDAPTNADRAWDAGLRDQDVVALVACSHNNDGPVPAANGVYFTVRSLRRSVRTSTLGSPKSASEGAERDRTWPAIVPSRPGRVQEVTREHMKVVFEGDEVPARKQTYALRGKHPYVKVGDRFDGSSNILAGSPRNMADLTAYLQQKYDPLSEVTVPDPIDRFAAVKALRFRPELHKRAVPVLEARLGREQEPRVALEIAASAAALGSGKGQDAIAKTLWHDERSDLSMEAILILSELRSRFARDALIKVATSDKFEDDERRQAAVWGLGKTGLKVYADLVQFIGDEDENVAFHAIAAFGSDAPRGVIKALIAVLLRGGKRDAPAASEALRVIGSADVLDELVTAANVGANVPDWILATLGRLEPGLVRQRMRGQQLLAKLEPMLLTANGANWLANGQAVGNMAFLMRQDL